MNRLPSPLSLVLCALLILTASAPVACAQTAPEFVSYQPGTNGEVALKLVAPAKSVFRVEQSADLTTWMSLFSAASIGTNPFTDGGAPFAGRRFYRAFAVEPATVLTGDHLPTADGDVVIHPINHATLVLGWQDKLIYVDPVGGVGRFPGIGKADLVLVTHNHGDHLDASTLLATRRTNAIVLAPAVVQVSLPASLKTNTTAMTNGAIVSVLGLTVEAVPAYNLTSAYHPKGSGNGYVLTIGGRRIYIGGDTEDIPEMRALQDIDVAFVPMDLPFTMSIPKAVSAVRQFRPKVVYPYHYSGSNVQQFKTQVGTDRGIEVRLRKWY